MQEENIERTYEAEPDYNMAVDELVFEDNK